MVHILLNRGERAKHNMTEAEIRIDYYSGLLAEAQTVKEEEEERLQVLTAFQQFLAAVTPSQSLKDLKRKSHEIYERVKVCVCVFMLQETRALSNTFSKRT